MNKITISSPVIANGKSFDISFPITIKEINNQIKEIFDLQHYGFKKVKNGTYVDFGANCGLASLYFSEIAKQVYSLEPNPEIYQALVENTKIRDNIKCFNVGVANVNCKALLYAEKNFVPQTLFNRQIATGIPIDTQEVDLVTPKQFYIDNNLEHVDVLKVDIEEGEYLIFPDDDFGYVAERTDYIIGEAHDQLQGGFPDIIPVMLKRWGYKTKFMKTKPNYYRQFYYNNPETGQKSMLSYPMRTIFLASK